MEAPGNVFERLNTAYETRVLELKAEFFRRCAKLAQYYEVLGQVSVDSLGDICKFLRDTRELALADYEASIASGIWETPAFVDLYGKTQDRLLVYVEKLLIRHLKAKNLSGISNVLGSITVLPATIDVTKVFFLSVLELLSEDYEESLFDSYSDPIIEQLSLYCLNRDHLWKPNSGRTPGCRWLMYECDLSCYQDDFYEACFPSFYKAVLAAVYHTHANYRHSVNPLSQGPADGYAFMRTTSQVANEHAIGLSQRKPESSSFLSTLQRFGKARELLVLEGYCSSSEILSSAYIHFISLFQGVVHFYFKELNSDSQGDSAIHKLMQVYANASEFLYAFFGLLSEPKPYLGRLVSEYQMEWQRESLVAALEAEFPASVNWLRCIRCYALEQFYTRVRTAVQKVCVGGLTSGTYNVTETDVQATPYIAQLIDLLIAHYEQPSLLGRKNRVMIRKTLAVFVTAMFKELRTRAKEMITIITAVGVEKLARDVSTLLESICELKTVKGKTGYAAKIRGLKEVQIWREVLVGLTTHSEENVTSKVKKWKKRFTGPMMEGKGVSLASILTMHIAK